MCLKCHGNLGCDQAHPIVILHCGEACGVCGGGATAHDCNSPVALEIHSYNLAVKRFSLRMRAKFLANLRDKGGWQEIGYGFAIKRLLHEAGELSEVLTEWPTGPSQWPRIIDESADVANFEVFIGSRAADEESQHQSFVKHTDEIMAKVEAEKAAGGK